MHKDDYPKLYADHIGISVPDSDASIAWYGHMLGFELEMRQHLPIIPAEIAFVRRGELRIELFQADGAKPLPPERREPNEDAHARQQAPMLSPGLRARHGGQPARAAPTSYLPRLSTACQWPSSVTTLAT